MWKESSDPEREVKKAYLEKLPRQPHNPPVVRRGDEIGPIQRIPLSGSGWFPRERPGRIPAVYRKGPGTTGYFLMRNVYHQQLSGTVYRTKHSANRLKFRKEERAGYSADESVYFIQDGRRTHGTPAVRP